MRHLSWQTTTLIMFTITAVLATSVYAVAAGWMSPSSVTGPIIAILVAMPGAFAVYMRGLNEMPPTPPGTEYKLVTSIRPPPGDELDPTTLATLDEIRAAQPPASAKGAKDPYGFR